jgi:sigma-E factor negative regulatory protein RseC
MKSQEETEISHVGAIEEISDESIKVRIVSTPSCVSCSANGICNASEIEEKIVEVAKIKDHNYAIGDVVSVSLKQSAGLHAVMLGYIYPFIVMFITLIIMINIVDSQGIAGLVALGMLVPYYGILYLTKSRQKESFQFEIK